jgi:hypothetical protein
VESFSGATPIPCDCGFDPDGMEYCLEGLIISDMFRREIITECNCICHGAAVALMFPVPDRELVLAA